MSKVFRLYKNGDNTFTDWHESASFHTVQRIEMERMV